MSTASPVFPNGLPQTGWILDSTLADAIGVSSETLRDWLTKFQIPHRRPGSKVFIQVEVFYQNLPDGLSDGEKGKSR